MSYAVSTVVRSGFSTGVAESFTVNRAVYGASTDFSSLVSFVAGVATGDYDIVFTPAAAGDYRARWTGNTSGEEFTGNWNVVTAAQADPAAALSGVTVTVTNPVISDGGPLKLYQGNDYATADTRSASWAFTGIPDLTAAQSVTLSIFTSTATALAKTGTVTNPGTATQTVTVQFTAVETTALDETANLRYVLNAVLASGRVVTLTRGIVEVVPSEP